MATGKKEELEATHARITRVYLRILEKLDPESEFYDATFMPNPAVLGHINKFLAQNDIKAVVVPDSPLAKLRDSGKLLSLPFLEPRERPVDAS